MSKTISIEQIQSRHADAQAASRLAAIIDPKSVLFWNGVERAYAQLLPDAPAVTTISHGTGRRIIKDHVPDPERSKASIASQRAHWSEIRSIMAEKRVPLAKARLLYRKAHGK